MKIKVRSWRMLTLQDKLFILKAISQRSRLKNSA
ncbi:hypothetical protein MGA3_11415 [Bacillus methanolicus MGA3]|uniref:Uncharacterized protein n=1 Tax=Bacillus methanolicus (strain MGA3 / ATCC 53907) TaxID=796606 RepID=I3E329_BACMM|nr:hypothetical protein BMMGA3_02695 [Bacillus methanolicus MGA3]EIJ80900.1 hypothetical protein MGA3_11415 [Bacillus methanolicus MGA3]